ncbi:MAG TPA: lanthionine synthetase LanC family protein [Candidatus Elarobacter sp.]|nr:lanthionine synthetase LanC family protein [Candidatus Elarobacter sp.]
MLHAVETPSAVPWRNPVYLEAASAVARRIARDAIWSDGRCTWFGWFMDPGPYGAFRPVRRTMGTDVYQGVAGIALFLAQLATLSQDDDIAALRDGAIRQIEARVAAAPAQPSFYGGSLGVGFTLAEIGALRGDDALVARGLAEVDRALATPFGPEVIDVMSGPAGAIAPLIDLAGRFARPDLLDAAQRFGSALLDAAVESAEGLSWATLPATAVKRNLLGFSHGVAGIVWALLELQRVRPDVRIANVVRDALRYERSFFDAAQRNWPDLRDFAALGMAAGGPAQPAFSTGWCHGAGGIGLSRLRLLELLPGDAEIAGEVEAAMLTVKAWLRATLESPSVFDMSPCHGVSGNAEAALLFAQHVQRRDAYELVDAVGRAAVDRYVRSATPFPCGVLGAGETPSLMTGIAGIGYFFLRLYDPDQVRSTLLTVPRSHTRERGPGAEDVRATGP